MDREAMAFLLAFILVLISGSTAAPTRLDKDLKEDMIGHPAETVAADHILNIADLPLQNCKDIQTLGRHNETGLYTVQPNGNGGAFTVFCDMESLGGGWTIVQRRIDDSFSFERDYSFYRNGFGHFFENFWLGLEKIHRLTYKREDMELYIGLESFDESTVYARYPNFAVENEDAGYTLRIGQYNKAQSTAGDSLSSHRGQKFSTHDNDRDALSRFNCAKETKGGWWYKNCHDSNLNGVWYENGDLANPNIPDGIIWQTWKGDTHSLKSVVMAIRPL